MKTKAAVVYEPGKRIEIEELDLDRPKDGEVLIRYLYAGLSWPRPMTTRRPPSWPARSAPAGRRSSIRWTRPRSWTGCSRPVPRPAEPARPAGRLAGWRLGSWS